MAQESKIGSTRNKGRHVSTYLTDERFEKISQVEEKFNELFGEAGRNKSKAIAYIIDCFDTGLLANFPKGRPRAARSAILN